VGKSVVAPALLEDPAKDDGYFPVYIKFFAQKLERKRKNLMGKK